MRNFVIGLLVIVTFPVFVVLFVIGCIHGLGEWVIDRVQENLEDKDA